jgi:selenocysteine lyase/cysteine desulfurase
MLAMGAMPLELSALTSLAAQTRNESPNSTGAAPLRLGPPPALPDKASFPDLKGTYLNAAATHPRSAGSNEQIKKLLAAQGGGPDAYRPSEKTVRESFAKLVNVDADEIAFVPSTQIGESFVASALGLPEKGAHVASDYLHFVGSQMMYTDMQKRGLEVTWVKMKDNAIPLDELDRTIIKGKTRLVAVSATSFVNGFQHDLKRVSEMAHAKGAMVYADIIQAAGNRPLDLRDAGVDAACCATYKWLMSSGTAFLYVRRASLAKMQPPFYHWTNFTTLPTTHMYPFDTPAKEIVDTYVPKEGAAGLFSMDYVPSPITLAGLEYSLPYIMNIGVENIQAHAQKLVDRLKAELPKRGYQLLTPLQSTTPIVTVAVKDSERLAPVFTAANVRITTRWNHIRVAASVFNDMDDVEKLLTVMPKA